MLQKIRELSKHLAIYGAGDVAIQALNFLLLPFYVRYLTQADYGVLALLASVEATVKLFFRWGVDGAFMRFWYDCEDEHARQRLASTLFFFLLGTNGVLLILALIASPFLSERLQPELQPELGFGLAELRRSDIVAFMRAPGLDWAFPAERLLQSPGYTLALQLVLLNTFAIGFTFIPFHVLRMQKRAREFSVLTIARSASTLVLRVILVMGAGLGIMGVVIADVVVTAVILTVMVGSAAGSARLRAPADGGRRPVRDDPIPVDSGDRRLLDGGQLRVNREDRARRIRVCVGAVLLRHGP